MPTDKQIRIAFISEIPTPYRMPVLKMLAKEKGVYCHFFFCAETQADRDWGIANYEGLEKTVLRGWQFQRKGKNTLTTFFNPEVVRYIHKGNYDLAIIGGWAQPTMILACFACLIKGIPFALVSESHALKPRNPLKKMLRRIFPGALIRKANGYLVTGTNSFNYLKYFGAKPESLFIFPNTVDVDGFIKESQRLQKKQSSLRDELKLPGSHNFIFVGRLVEVKGVFDLLLAFERVAEELPDWGLVIIGDGLLRNKLTNQLRSKPWKDRVVMVPFVEPERLISYYTASDVFVLPSHDEPWGVVVNEAIACGLPAILSNNVGAAADLVKQGSNGFCFTTGNATELADYMLRLGSDETLRKKMAKQALTQIQDWGYNRNLRGFHGLLKHLFDYQVAPHEVQSSDLPYETG